MNDNTNKETQRGGKRTGAGRPKTGRKRLVLSVTPKEAEALSEVLAFIRKGGENVCLPHQLYTAYQERILKSGKQNSEDLNQNKPYVEACTIGKLLNIKREDIKADCMQAITNYKNEKIEEARQKVDSGEMEIEHFENYKKKVLNNSPVCPTKEFIPFNEWLVIKTKQTFY